MGDTLLQRVTIASDKNGEGGGAECTGDHRLAVMCRDGAGEGSSDPQVPVWVMAVQCMDSVLTMSR